jgi:hypothetical protein
MWCSNAVVSAVAFQAANTASTTVQAISTMPHNTCQWLAYVFAVALGILVSRAIQWFFMDVLLEPAKTVRKTREKINRLQEKLTGITLEEKHGTHPVLGTRLSGWVGAIEIVLYASCVVFEHPEFIAVWFATKYVAAFRSWERSPIGRTFYYRSLFGTGLNILLGFFTGKFALWAISHFGTS